MFKFTYNLFWSNLFKIYQNNEDNTAERENNFSRIMFHIRFFLIIIMTINISSTSSQKILWNNLSDDNILNILHEWNSMSIVYNLETSSTHPKRSCTTHSDINKIHDFVLLTIAWLPILLLVFGSFPFHLNHAWHAYHFRLPSTAITQVKFRIARSI